MISVVNLWNQLQITAKTGTSGYQSQDDFNRDLDTVQKKIANILCDNYDISQKVEDALFGLLVSKTSVASSTGIFAYSNSFGQISNPADYFRLISLWVNVGNQQIPAGKIASNQISVYSTAYVRKPSIANNNYSYYFLDGNMQMMPMQQMLCTLVYCKIPPVAAVTLTQSSTTNSDYITVTAAQDLIWPAMDFNLFYYHMLEMLGVEVKDNLLLEYSQLGISKEYLLGMSKGEQP